VGRVVFLAHIAPGGTSAIDPVTDTLTTLPNQPWAGTGPSGTATRLFIPGHRQLLCGPLRSLDVQQPAGARRPRFRSRRPEPRLRPLQLSEPPGALRRSTGPGPEQPPEPARLLNTRTKLAAGRPGSSLHRGVLAGRPRHHRGLDSLRRPLLYDWTSWNATAAANALSWSRRARDASHPGELSRRRSRGGARPLRVAVASW
jgi:hypothetical protein